MRTLVVTSSWPRTGDELAGTFVRTDAIERARTGEVVVAAPQGPGRARGGEGLTVVDVPHGGLFGSPGAAERLRVAPWRALGLVPFARVIGRLIERVRPSRIVAHWLLPSGLVVDVMLAIHKRERVELELVAHGADVRLLRSMPRFVARPMLERLVARAAIIRAVSPPLARRLCDLAPVARSKLVVAPMPLATEDATSREAVRVHAKRLAPGARPLHVVASRLVESKQVERAIEHVWHHGGRLVVVGDGPRRAALMELARSCGVDASFLGARSHDETLAWIAAADVVLAPLSVDEGAPTVPREAESLGRTVIRLEPQCRRR
jgi:glycosyltransferase involved in cell wall biosynthesis